METVEATRETLGKYVVALDLAGYENTGDFMKYAPLFEKAREYASMSNDIYLTANINIIQGENHLYNNRIDKAINSYKEAVDLLENKQWGEDLRFAPLNKLALCYAQKGENETALQYANEAKKYVKTITNKRAINSSLCDIYINLKQWDKAETSLLQADDTISYLGKSIYLEKMIQWHTKERCFTLKT